MILFESNQQLSCDLQIFIHVLVKHFYSRLTAFWIIVIFKTCITQTLFLPLFCIVDKFLNVLYIYFLNVLIPRGIYIRFSFSITLLLNMLSKIEIFRDSFRCFGFKSCRMWFILFYFDNSFIFFYFRESDAQCWRKLNLLCVLSSIQTKQEIAQSLKRNEYSLQIDF